MKTLKNHLKRFTVVTKYRNLNLPALIFIFHGEFSTGKRWMDSKRKHFFETEAITMHYTVIPVRPLGMPIAQCVMDAMLVATMSSGLLSLIKTCYTDINYLPTSSPFSLIYGHSLLHHSSVWPDWSVRLATASGMRALSQTTTSMVPPILVGYKENVSSFRLAVLSNHSNENSGRGTTQGCCSCNYEYY